MNVYDSLIMQNIVKPLGFTVVTQPLDADIIILNTCHIREKASEKLYSELGQIRKLQKKPIIVVAGCVAQAEGKEIFERAPFIDIIVGPQSLHTLPELIIKIQRSKGRYINIEFPVISKFDSLPVSQYTKDQGISAFISVQEGCDKFCTFCVVPYTRGAEYSRTVEEILQETEVLADNGAQEITLIGQNVNAYHGTHKGNPCDLGMLIQHIAKIKNIKRIRYTTSHPRDMHTSLYDAHKYEPKLMPFVHLPIQSGSNKVLRKMNRKHTYEEYIDIIETLKNCRKDIAFSSDFIVGFPEETEQDFEETIKLVKTVTFAQAYSFKYSPRPGTPGAEYINQVPESEKSKRLSRLQKLLFQQQLSFNKETVGKTISVLFGQRKGKFNNQIIGKTPHMQSVYITTETPEYYYNKIINVKILNGYQNSLEGEIVK
ncbi:tRNA-i(6)A37 thiotransferase enzyme MiaB [Candidatus Neoehrlichia lotoris str. RAC413]|uniref:tRNA-2-methylthio-N(6)-dimethylallyladenosine synthase n=2 Tax=Candidatus Neoehrlichia procyonis TaxID=467750 RepID=A0A0F3NLL0_9RICK|nr:tRNA-i(6)A37 thiotransferase enzyme MiaB [Candidatus Neoehrlichia lotoris str. RAC413]